MVRKLSDHAPKRDLGTVANPGNNEFSGNTGLNLNLASSQGATVVTAIGNAWNPLIQGSDIRGKYPTTATVVGPVAAAAGNNYALASGWSLIR
ncbi:MAG TPA: hypothetical protein VHW23_00305 [Kofleriaceae bacterium]|nr:hypothetical protein [Kofleriaceae bacterium]